MVHRLRRQAHRAASAASGSRQGCAQTSSGRRNQRHGAQSVSHCLRTRTNQPQEEKTAWRSGTRWTDTGWTRSSTSLHYQSTPGRARHRRIDTRRTRGVHPSFLQDYHGPAPPTCVAGSAYRLAPPSMGRTTSHPKRAPSLKQSGGLRPRTLHGEGIQVGHGQG